MKNKSKNLKGRIMGMTNMTENLADMIKKSMSTGEPEKKEEIKIVSPEPRTKPDPKPNQVIKKDTKEEKADTIPVTNLIDWFTMYHKSLPDVNHVQAKIRGVDPKETLIFTLPHPKGGKGSDGQDKRKLHSFDNADKRSVLNIKPVVLNSYNNETFRIIYHLRENIFLKAYGVKTGLYVTFCAEIEGLPIPYKVVRIRKREKIVKFELHEIEKIYKKLSEPADYEGLLIQYPQINKYKDMTTIKSAIELLLNIQKDVVDITHHLKIDFIITDMIK
jgi:hypothetical protein